MIVWGGNSDTGGQYDPVTDSWTVTSTANAPVARSSHTAVWTGTRMIVWGGVPLAGGMWTNTGGQYDPVSDTWTATTTTNAPADRQSHLAVWTGSRMLVWGGSSSVGDPTNTGGLYDPAADSWAPVTTSNAPPARFGPTAIWTGARVVIWGGQAFTGVGVNTGGQYDPIGDSWTSTTTTGAPSARYLHTAVWTGSRMIVWGGANTNNFNTGGQYDPIGDAWTPTTINGPPSKRGRHTAVWTGSRMVVWGGFLSGLGGGYFNTGGVYDPTADSWTATSLSGAPAARQSHGAVWTGSRMILWGGDPITNTGGQYFFLNLFVKN